MSDPIRERQVSLSAERAFYIRKQLVRTTAEMSASQWSPKRTHVCVRRHRTPSCIHGDYRTTFLVSGSAVAKRYIMSSLMLTCRLLLRTARRLLERVGFLRSIRFYTFNSTNLTHSALNTCADQRLRCSNEKRINCAQSRMQRGTASQIYIYIYMDMHMDELRKNYCRCCKLRLSY
jgi:hypothetical protein